MDSTTTNTAIFINLKGKQYSEIDGIFKDIIKDRYLVQYSGQKVRTNKDVLLTEGNIWVFFKHKKECTLLGKVSSVRNVQARTENEPIVVQYYIDKPVMEVIPEDKEAEKYIYKEGVMRYMEKHFGLTNSLKDYTDGIMKLK
jgi:hypothetical protein